MPALVIWIIAIVVIILDTSAPVISGALGTAIGFSLAFALGESARNDRDRLKQEQAKHKRQLKELEEKLSQATEQLESGARDALLEAWRHAWLDYEESIGGPAGIELAHQCRDAFAAALNELASPDLPWEDRIRCVQISYRHFIRPHATDATDLDSICAMALQDMKHYLETHSIPYLIPHAEQQTAALEHLLARNVQSTTSD